MPFSQLGFSPALLPVLLRALDEKGYTAPTPIQQAAIPAILEGRDLVASAQTGSGKTAAFALPLLQHLATTAAPGGQHRPVRALILVPTRELAAQVGEAIVGFAKVFAAAHQGRGRVRRRFHQPANDEFARRRRHRGRHARPPARFDRPQRLDPGGTAALVLDEADRLLDLGFGEELNRILALLPAKRQTLFFSATFPPAIEALANSLLRNPLRVEVAPVEQTIPDITQRAIEVDAPRRTQLLRHLVQTEKWERVLVFVATKHAAEIVADKLRKVEIEAEPFHGELSQGKRTQVLQDFKIKAVQVVVATDVAARGIDIAQLPVVVNYDLPRSVTDYTHRIGRTGRAGESGVAVSFVSAATEAHFRLIEKRLGIQVVREQVAGFEPVEVAVVNPADPAGTGGIKGKRPSKKDKLRATAEKS
jgi:ATP-dependent RNA helicase RhlE